MLSAACKNVNSSQDDTFIVSNRDAERKQGYNFNSPEVFLLDKKLTEISGLAFDRNKDYFLAHNDEKGHIYVINKTDGAILKDFKFGSKGDYEGIACLNDKYVVVGSNGRLHFYDDENDETQTVKTKLSSTNDVEGLCFLSENNQLLLACKGRSFENLNEKATKVIYSYDLDSNQLNEDPFLKINRDDLEKIVKRDYLEESESKIRKLVNRIKDFAPSGIAIHPETKAYYIVSARGSTLVVIDSNKELDEVIFLNDKTNKQPEGISFDKESNLYISTEGRGLRAKIFKFRKH